MKSFSLKPGQDIVEPHCYIYESTYICNFMWFEELIALIFLIKVQIDISLLPVNISLFFDQLFPLEKITMDRKVKECDFHAFISASGWWNLNRSSHSRRTILFCNCQCTVWALLLCFYHFDLLCSFHLLTPPIYHCRHSNTAILKQVKYFYPNWGGGVEPQMGGCDAQSC